MVIDDSDTSRKILETFLKNVKFENIYVEKSARNALSKLEEISPELIVCDIFMPEMNGADFCKEVRKLEQFSNVPILMATSSESSKDINNAFLAGANDFVLKPVQREEFLTKVLTHLDSSLTKKRLINELSMARELQMGLMPSIEKRKSAYKKYNVEIAGILESCFEVGGDFWGFEEISHSEIGFFSIDVAGHGVSSALNCFRIHSILSADNYLIHNTDILATRLNKKLYEILPTGNFATMFYAVINVEENFLEYSSAAAPRSIIVRKNGETEILEESNLPLGADKDTKYVSKRVPFNKGDVLMFFSDALTETPNAQGEFFNEEKLAKSLMKISGNAQQILDGIMERFDKFRENNIVNDDLTSVIIKRV